MTDDDPTRRLTAAFYARDTAVVARDLIGCLLVTRVDRVETIGRIVETEAYHGADDLASHAARLRTGRVAVMAGPVGVSYVYRSYGIHAMLNVVAHPPGSVGAVLLRALEPIAGLETMRARRGGHADRLLCSGPGRLCSAMGITLDDHGVNVTTSESIQIVPDPGSSTPLILASGRVGISCAKEDLWRFFEADNPYVSATRRGTPVNVQSGILSKT